MCKLKAASIRAVARASNVQRPDQRLDASIKRYNMNTITEIQQAVQNLDDRDLESLRRWFDEYFADAWDRQIEDDAKAGKLDKLADSALAELRAGRCIMTLGVE